MQASANTSHWGSLGLALALNVVSGTDGLADTEEDKNCWEWKRQGERKHQIEWDAEVFEKSRLRPRKHTTNVEGHCHRTGSVGGRCQNPRRQSW